MCGLLETLLFAAFGFLGLAKGEFKITRNRMVRGSIGRVLGGLLLIAAGFPILFRVEVLYAAIVRYGLLIIVIIIGLVTSEKIVPAEDEAPATESESD